MLHYPNQKSMKRISIAILLLLPFFLFSQNYSPSVISSLGNQGNTTNYYMSYTIGQLITTSGGNSIILLTQGFQQSFIKSIVTESPVICMVTLDSFTQKNMVIWERQQGHATAYYNIFRETTSAGVYEKIGSVPFDSLPVFIDNGSSPRKQAYRYRITAVDSNANESAQSPVHKTIHLTASQGSANEHHLIWTPYEGKTFSTYYIYRGKQPNKMMLIDSIASSLTSYSDYVGNPGIQYYFVSAQFLGDCSPNVFRANNYSGPYSQSLSNIKEYTTKVESYLFVSPPVQSSNGNMDTLVFEMFTNLDTITATPDKTWLTTEVDTANDIITVYVQQNTSTNIRTASITVSGTGVADQTVSVIQNGYYSVDENLLLTDLSVYPNPYRGFTNITLTLAGQAHMDVSVYSLTGQLVKTLFNGSTNPAMYHYRFSALENGYATGLYMLVVKLNDQKIIRKLVELK